VLTELLDGAGSGVRPQVTAPVAFALEGLISAGPSAAFPEFPSAWINAMAQSDQPVTVPEGSSNSSSLTDTPACKNRLNDGTDAVPTALTRAMKDPG
jgi:hypothetical protein